MPIGLGRRLGLLTGSTPPVFVSITNISISGGTVRITGMNFVGATVWLGGGIGNVSTTTVSTTVVTFAAPAHAVGNIDVMLTNSDGQFFYVSNGLAYVTVSDPGTIVGGDLTGWYRGDSLTQSGGTVTGWTDKSATGNNLTVPGGSTGPTYNISSSSFNSFATATFDGVANILTGAFTNLSGHTMFVYVVYRLITAGSNPTMVAMAFTSAAELRVGANGTTSKPQSNYNGTLATWGSAVANTPSAFYAYVLGTGASTETTGVNSTNLTEITNTSGPSTQPTATGTFAIGGQTTITGFANAEIAEVVVSRVVLNSTQLTQIYDYINFRYLIDPTISFTAATSVGTGGGLMRVEGAGFNSSTTVSMQGVGTLATTVKSATNLQFTVPASSAGPYDLTISNANDGQTLMVSHGIVVTSTADPMTILGTKCVAWGRADQVALNSTTISAFTDLARLGNKITQGTAANQPTYNASDANFNNQASASFTGSPVTMSGTVTFDAGSASVFMLAVLRVTSVSGVPLDYNTAGAFELRMDGAGKPLSWRNATSVTWASSIQNLTRKVYVYNQSTGTGTETLGVSVNFGTEVTGSAAVTNVISGQTLWIGSQAATTYATMQIAEYIICDQIPSGAELTAISTYLTGRYT